MQALITGGAGFIGSHIAEACVAKGWKVRVLDNFRSGNRKNLAALDLELIEGDVTSFEAVYRAMAGCDVVFHQAALVSVPHSIKDPILNHQINVTGAHHVFESARRHGIKRVVYASSAAVYGNDPQLPCKLDGQLNPISPYAAAKQINEIYAATYNQAFGMECIGLRYFNVFGPRQDPSSPYSGFLSLCCKTIVNKGSLTIFGDGEQTRDFVYVDDVVQANLLAGETDYQPSKGVLNVASGRSTSLNQVVKTIGSMSADPLCVEQGPARIGDIRHSAADISAIRKQLNFRPNVSLEHGLELTLKWYRRQADHAV